MKVLHVVATSRRRGAEVFASDLVNSLADIGVSQRVAVIHRDRDLGVSLGCPVDYLRAKGRGLPMVRIDPSALLRLRTLVSEWSPDILQAHGGEPLKYCATFGRKRRARVVYRRIGAVHPWTKGRLRKVAHARLMMRAAQVVAVADGIRLEMIRDLHLPAARVVTIPNAVDLTRMDPTRDRDAVRRALGLQPDALVVISLGSLTWDKDPLAHLSVTARVGPSLPKLVHVFVGDGPLRRRLEDEIAARGLAERVLVLGSRSDVGDVLVASDAMLLASRTEGLPACVIEAGACGVPVVGYALGGVAEAVLDGVTGSLCRPGDIDGLAHSLRSLLEDEERRNRFGQAGRDRIRSEFDIRDIAPRYLRLYEELLVAS
jgi:glycosyltransferase involved in cell wall biosynthesis